ncbi:MAG: GNAT family N-acetyltransferase [Gemmatimonadales bacterium]
MPQAEVIRTYLEMRTREDLRSEPGAIQGVRLEPVDPCPPELYRFLYSAVGREYHWRDRLAWTEQQLQEWLRGPSTIWVMRQGQSLAGYFELRRHEDGSVEIVYFGLMPGFLGRGLGRHLLTRSVEEAWALGPSRVWVHTCTLDHPAALPNYLNRGFRTVREEKYQVELP